MNLLLFYGGDGVGKPVFAGVAVNKETFSGIDNERGAFRIGWQRKGVQATTAFGLDINNNFGFIAFDLRDNATQIQGIRNLHGQGRAAPHKMQKEHGSTRCYPA
jgi:hypothetical protein